jgi:OOP family OmpA-OmpF porin
MNKNSVCQRARLVGAILVFGLLAACAGNAPPQTVSEAPEATSANTPQLAGAWYQIYFDTKSTEINERGNLIVKTVAQVVANVADNGAMRVTVIGKTDRVGAPPANMALSKTRAETVRDALISAGVPSDRIDTTWTGERKLAVSTANNITEQRNRVVDVTVIREAR